MNGLQPQLTFSYDVYTLPTAQHRAGLAGLLILCDLLKNEGVPLPLIEEPHETGQPGLYRFTWSPDSLRSILNYFYNAHMPEVTVKSKWAGQDPLRIEIHQSKDGKEEKRFVYQQLTPKAEFFRKLDMPEPWLRLWCNALWQTLRAVPKTRIPYENRYAEKDALDIPSLWKEWETFLKDLKKGKVKTADIPGCFFLGSQAHNADMIPFTGRLDENFLLHFWPVVMSVYQPEIIKIDGSTQFQGYVLVVPDVLNMRLFSSEFPNIIQQLDHGQPVGFRPRGSIISIHQEGALEYGRHLMQIASSHIRESDLYHFSVCGIEAYHLEKRGNNVHMLASDRLEIDKEILRKYEQIREKVWNPIFKRQCILNLLTKREWYAGFDDVFATRPKEHFLGGNRLAKSFAEDVRKKESELYKKYNRKRSFA